MREKRGVMSAFNRKSGGGKSKNKKGGGRSDSQEVDPSGTGSSTGNKMVADKMVADKMAADKMAADKMAADKMAADDPDRTPVPSLTRDQSKRGSGIPVAMPTVPAVPTPIPVPAPLPSSTATGSARIPDSSLSRIPDVVDMDGSIASSTDSVATVTANGPELHAPMHVIGQDNATSNLIGRGAAGIQNGVLPYHSNQYNPHSNHHGNPGRLTNGERGHKDHYLHLKEQHPGISAHSNPHGNQHPGLLDPTDNIVVNQAEIPSTPNLSASRDSPYSRDSPRDMPYTARDSPRDIPFSRDSPHSLQSSAASSAAVTPTDLPPSGMLRERFRMTVGEIVHEIERKSQSLIAKEDFSTQVCTSFLILFFSFFFFFFFLLLFLFFSFLSLKCYGNGFE